MNLLNLSHRLDREDTFVTLLAEAVTTPLADVRRIDASNKPYLDRELGRLRDEYALGHLTLPVFEERVSEVLVALERIENRRLTA